MKKINFSVKKSIPLNIALQKEVRNSLGEASVSNSKVRRLIISGSVQVNGSQCRIPSYELRTGDSVLVLLDEKKFFYEKKPEDVDFVLEETDVLFEDDCLIVVNKPAFLPTEKTIVESRKNLHQCVVDYLWKKNPSLRNPPYAGIMHRLDYETSGVILFTKTRSVNVRMSEIFQKHEIQKTYLALASKTELWKKNPQKKDFIVEGMMKRVSNKSSACKMGFSSKKDDKDSQFSRTEFTVLKEDQKLCLLECRPETGRTHQIRLHASSIGLPLLGDDLYGGEKGYDELKGRIMLHAQKLVFPHPVTGEKICVQAPCNELFFTIL